MHFEAGERDGAARSGGRLLIRNSGNNFDRLHSLSNVKSFSMPLCNKRQRSEFVSFIVAELLLVSHFVSYL